MRATLSLAAIASLLTLTSAAPSKLKELRARALAIATEYETELVAKLSNVKRNFMLDGANVGVQFEQEVPENAHVPYSQLYKMKDFLPLPAGRPDMTFSISTAFRETTNELEARSASISKPAVAALNPVGASLQSPSTQYFSKQYHNSIPTLSKTLLKPIIETSLTTGYAIYNGTGTLSVRLLGPL